MSKFLTRSEMVAMGWTQTAIKAFEHSFSSINNDLPTEIGKTSLAATAAQTTADSAVSSSAIAQTTANTANSNATTAQTTANNATNKIQTASPTTGQTIVLDSSYKLNLIIKPSASLASLSLALPSSPQSGQAIAIMSTQSIASISFSGGSVFGVPTSLVANQSFKIIFDGAAWYVIS